MKKLSIAILLLFSCCAASAEQYQGKFVAINGQQLTQQQIAALEMQLGSHITPGNYLYDYQSGCWANLTTGEQGCFTGNAGGQYNSRYGSGEWNNSGDWSYYSDAAGGGVGGSGDGCVYAFGWSNC
jgi:hypothetical protein